MMKGNVTDIVFLVIIMFMFAVSAVIGLYVLGEFNDKLETVSDGKYNNTQALNTSKSVEDVFNVMDNSFPLLFIGANMAIIFLSFMVRGQPFFFIFILLLLAGLVLISAIFSNTYYAIAHSTIIDAAVDYGSGGLDIIDLMMTNLVVLQVIFGFIDTIIMLSFSGSKP